MVDSIKAQRGMVVLVIALAVAACSSASPTTQTATDGTFVVRVSVPPGTHHASDAVGVVAILTYEGPQPSITVDSGDEGFVWFSFKQLDGSREMGGPLSRLICSPSTTMVRGSSATFRPAKSVVYGADDPNAAFYSRWASDPEVHLPAGRWQIVATAQIWDGETCIGAKPDHVITLPPLLVDVVP
jgi:hypothetical protein